MAKRTNRSDLATPDVLRARAGQIADPILDIEKMSESERDLFNRMVGKSLELTHQVNPIQQVMNQKIWFASSMQSALYVAGMAVAELRALQSG